MYLLFNVINQLALISNAFMAACPLLIALLVLPTENTRTFL